jgi:hypothetical protein
MHICNFQHWFIVNLKLFTATDAQAALLATGTYLSHIRRRHKCPSFPGTWLLSTETCVWTWFCPFSLVSARTQPHGIPSDPRFSAQAWPQYKFIYKNRWLGQRPPSFGSVRMFAYICEVWILYGYFSCKNILNVGDLCGSYQYNEWMHKFPP